MTLTEETDACTDIAEIRSGPLDHETHLPPTTHVTLAQDVDDVADHSPRRRAVENPWIVPSFRLDYILPIRIYSSIALFD